MRNGPATMWRLCVCVYMKPLAWIKHYEFLASLRGIRSIVRSGVVQKDGRQGECRRNLRREGWASRGVPMEVGRVSTALCEDSSSRRKADLGLPPSESLQTVAAWCRPVERSKKPQPGECAAGCCGHLCRAWFGVYVCAIAFAHGSDSGRLQPSTLDEGRSCEQVFLETHRGTETLQT